MSALNRDPFAGVKFKFDRVKDMQQSSGVNSAVINTDSVLQSADLGSGKARQRSAKSLQREKEGNSSSLQSLNLCNSKALLSQTRDRLQFQAQQKKVAETAMAQSKLRHMKEAHDFNADNLKMEARLTLLKADLERRKAQKNSLGGLSWKSAAPNQTVTQYGKQVLTTYKSGNSGSRSNRSLFQNIGSEFAQKMRSQVDYTEQRYQIPRFVGDFGTAKAGSTSHESDVQVEDPDMPSWRVPTPLATQSKTLMGKNLELTPEASRPSNSEKSNRSAASREGWDTNKASLLDGPSFDERESGNEFQQALLLWRQGAANYDDVGSSSVRPLTADMETLTSNSATGTEKRVVDFNVKFSRPANQMTYMEKLLLQKFQKEMN